MKAFRQIFLFVLLPLLAVIGGAAVSFHLYGEFGAELEARQRLQSAAQLVATLVDRDVRSLFIPLRTVLFQESLQDYERFSRMGDFDATDRVRAQLQSQLQRLRNSDEHCESVAILDANGECLVVEPEAAADEGLFDPPAELWFLEAIAIGEFVGFEPQGKIRVAVAHHSPDGTPHVAMMLYDFQPAVASVAEETMRNLPESELCVTDRISQVLFQWGTPSGPEVLPGDATMEAMRGTVTLRQQRSAALAQFYANEQILFGALTFVTLAILLVAASGTLFVTHSLREAHRRIDEANRAKSEFLASMSHEIRTPMNGILGMLELLRSAELSPLHREHVDLARESAESLLRILNDILDFSKVEAGKLELEQESFAYRKVVDNTTQTLAQRAREKGLELSAQTDDDVPEELLGDAGRFRQVLINLIGNALKFTETGAIYVRTGVERWDPLGVMLHVCVQDTGIGIADEQQPSIFDAFSQADKSTTRRYGGTGLGLTIAAELVRLMGGRIWVESEIGQGSTFHFTAFFGVISLDLIERPGEQGEAMEEAKLETDGESRPARILLAEDGRVNQKVAVSLLERRGHSVQVANNGREAVQAAARETFDVALMDVEMPEMDGIQATMQIRDREKGTDQHLPIVALTAHAIKGDREKFLAAGMDDYLSKPVKPALLYQVVERYSGNSGNGSNQTE